MHSIEAPNHGGYEVKGAKTPLRNIEAPLEEIWRRKEAGGGGWEGSSVIDKCEGETWNDMSYKTHKRNKNPLEYLSLEMV